MVLPRDDAAALIQDIQHRLLGPAPCSLLVMGRPGSGKTSLLRALARSLAAHGSVIAVDTTHELGGESPAAHAALGRARRMMVPSLSVQHAVMMEAAVNHQPQLLVVDEIGTSDEVRSLSLVRQRGVSLAVGLPGTLRDLISNPQLAALAGGVLMVPAADRMGVRVGAPLADVVVEVLGRDRLAVYPRVGRAIDQLLQYKQQAEREVRWRAGGQMFSQWEAAH